MNIGEFEFLLFWLSSELPVARAASVISTLEILLGQTSSAFRVNGDGKSFPDEIQVQRTLGNVYEKSQQTTVNVHIETGDAGMDSNILLIVDVKQEVALIVENGMLEFEDLGTRKEEGLRDVNLCKCTLMQRAYPGGAEHVFQLLFHVRKLVTWQAACNGQNGIRRVLDITIASWAGFLARFGRRLWFAQGDYKLAFVVDAKGECDFPGEFAPYPADSTYDLTEVTDLHDKEDSRRSFTGVFKIARLLCFGSPGGANGTLAILLPRLDSDGVSDPGCDDPLVYCITHVLSWAHRPPSLQHENLRLPCEYCG